MLHCEYKDQYIDHASSSRMLSGYTPKDSKLGFSKNNGLNGLHSKVQKFFLPAYLPAETVWRVVLLCSDNKKVFGADSDPRFSNKQHSESLHLCVLSLAFHGFLRFTSGATPADLLMPSKDLHDGHYQYYWCYPNLC